MPKKVELSIEEAVATLLRSELPTLIAEGDDDYLALRGLESRCADTGISVFPVGGKDAALSVWAAVRGRRNALTCVIVDKDLWMFIGTPQAFRHRSVIETKGFSIENDLCEDWDWERLMSPAELTSFRDELEIVAKWFSSRVHRWLGGEDVTTADHPNRILNNPEGDHDDPLGIVANPKLKLRGKTMIELAARQLSNSNRQSKYSKRNLLELSAIHHGANMQRIENRVRQLFE